MDHMTFPSLHVLIRLTIRMATVVLTTLTLLCGAVHSETADAKAPAPAREVRAAVAANFTAAMNELSRDFTAATGRKVVASFGASGQLFAQISNGAPFDLLLGADKQYTGQLVDKGLGVADSRFIYARGRLALWSSTPGYVDAKGEILKKADFAKIAIANPRLAPYGRAAEQSLKAMGLYETLQARFVTGENISQAQQFVASGSVPLGFVALAQVNALPEAQRGSFWIVPTELYEPLDQEAVLLKSAQGNAAAKAFLTYLKTPEAQRIIRRYGYELPR
jgi:molybdate transport system substrate-binding protein